MKKEVKVSLVGDVESHATDVTTVQELKTKDERWKGILFMNLYILVLVLATLGAKFIYHRHPEMEPEQLLMGRGIFACVFVVLIVNKDMK